jgi:hypothetical protein
MAQGVDFIKFFEREFFARKIHTFFLKWQLENGILQKVNRCGNFKVLHLSNLDAHLAAECW